MTIYLPCYGVKRVWDRGLGIEPGHLWRKKIDQVGLGTLRLSLLAPHTKYTAIEFPHGLGCVPNITLKTPPLSG